MTNNAKTVAFLWDNFGPMHIDRCVAVGEHLASDWRVVGIEQFSKSNEYEWVGDERGGFEKVTLFSENDRSRGILFKAVAIVKALRKCRADAVFMCNWDRPEVFLAAIYARLSFRQVLTMGCSKFDDMPRYVWREALKSLFYLPYRGGIGSGERSFDYMRFLGVPADRLARPYNTLSIARIQEMSGSQPAPGGLGPDERHFTIVARFVEKKNVAMALRAYAIYCSSVDSPKPLHLCGSGVLEEHFRELVNELGLKRSVVFRGFLQTEQIAQVLSETYALILPSIEEQFGNVVIEAQAMGVPVLVSDNCGARDHLVRTAVNGFVFEPDNPRALSYFMLTIHRDFELWRSMCHEALCSAPLGDVSSFAVAVAKVIKS